MLKNRHYCQAYNSYSALQGKIIQPQHIAFFPSSQFLPFSEIQEKIRFISEVYNEMQILAGSRWCSVVFTNWCSFYCLKRGDFQNAKPLPLAIKPEIQEIMKPFLEAIRYKFNFLW